MMSYFPFYMDICGKKGVIVGGGRVALHKIEKLLPFHPRLIVVAPKLLPEILALSEEAEAVQKSQAFAKSQAEFVEKRQGITKSEAELVEKPQGIAISEAEDVEKRQGIAISENEGMEKSQGIAKSEEEEVEKRQGFAISEEEDMEKPQGIVKSEAELVEKNQEILNIRDVSWNRWTGGSLECHRREFLEKDLKDAMFVIAATDDEKINAQVSQFCKARGIPVNVVDDKEKCTFIFPSLVKKGALTVAVSTEGASPQIAATLRRQVEKTLPAQIEDILDYLAWLRPIAKSRIQDPEKRSAFLKETAQLCFEEDLVLTQEETYRRLEEMRK